MYPSYSNNLLEIVKIINASISSLSIIDIGANIGDSIVLMKNVSKAKILAIEPEHAYYKFLIKNVSGIKSVKTINECLGEKDTTKYMQLTRSNGSATFRKSQYGRNSTKIRKLDSVLKKYPEFLSADFIKVDTDGFDYLVLRGARSYLKKSKPIIFFEYWPKGLNDVGEDGIKFIKYLASLGYSKSIVFDNFGRYFLSVDLTNTNLMLDLHNYIKNNKDLERNDYDICTFLNKDEIIYNKIRNYYLKK
jgi:FkbM family methyltransferase